MALTPRNRNRIKLAAAATQAAPTVALYLRVSSETQATDGNGIDSQRTALRTRCEREGWTDSIEFVDAGISGKSTDRPEFQRMMDAARSGAVQVVMAAKLDRLARNTVDFLQTADELQKVGCRLVMLEPDIDYGTPTGQVMATMFAGFAQWERSLIAQRVMSGKAEQAAAGEFNGSPIPYGYAPDWSIIESEAATVRRIFQEFNEGGSFNAIAEGLNQDGITTRAGAVWRHPQVKHIVRNGTYAGLRQWNGTEATDEGLPPIVSVDTYRQAEARQTRRGNPTFGKKAGEDCCLQSGGAHGTV